MDILVYILVFVLFAVIDIFMLFSTPYKYRQKFNFWLRSLVPFSGIYIWFDYMLSDEYKEVNDQ